MRCPDCPHLDPDALAAHGITPRVACCVDRMPGHRALEERIAKAKAEAATLPTRQQRRAAERQMRKPSR
jgi:hypothetical protein